jgi:hypothetical protein
MQKEYKKVVRWHHCFGFLTVSVVTAVCSQLVVLQRKQSWQSLDWLRFLHSLERNKSFGWTIKTKTVYTKYTDAVNFLFYFLLQSLVYCCSTYLQTVLHPVISHYWPVDLHIFLQLTNHHVTKQKLHVSQKIVNRKTDTILLASLRMLICDRRHLVDSLVTTTAVLTFITSDTWNTNGHFLWVCVGKP